MLSAYVPLFRVKLASVLSETRVIICTGQATQAFTYTLKPKYTRMMEKVPKVAACRMTPINAI
jgi:hypothetical protein